MNLGAGEIAGLAAAGLAAGAINAAAGGGTLISFPALVAVGYAPLTANVTNTVALCPGYAGGAYSYRRELRGQRRRIVALAAVTVAGSIGGAALLGATSQHVFRVVAPVLVLFACLLLAAQPWVRRRLRAPAGRDRRSVLVAQLPASVCGGYFGAA